MLTFSSQNFERNLSVVSSSVTKSLCSSKLNHTSLFFCRADSTGRKAMVSPKTPCQLSVIKETPWTNIRPKKAANPCSASPAANCTPSRSLSRGRRPATIPKEPHFHSIHVPKSCTGLHKENELMDAQQN